ncbi:hypothetical protein SAMN04488483_2859 [Pseudomonas helmanticensis]|uniref:Uncharacterized protein n=1 Tax=Pseudomonas helmanticensis TaxID=1471381 RepID=A0ACD2U6H1_9PSED|nr:hypothetical protein [Pseudomonas helmanticensis]SMQ26300.1 hypothetical protein SAMN04488483_2859 [Pseudomonas helmanticensis]
MSLLHEQTPIVTVDFRLPPDFRAPEGGENETVVSVKAITLTPPITIKDWRHPSVFDIDWKFSFPHHYHDVGVKYQINVQMFHDQQPLLLALDYFVIVNTAPHRQTLHLSPIGFLHVQVQEPRTVAEHEAVTISLHDADHPDTQLARITHDERTAASFYLQYDPDSVMPGRRYALSGVENRYRQSILVTPSHVELAPVSPNLGSWLSQWIAQWLKKPLRLFTDVNDKIR